MTTGEGDSLHPACQPHGVLRPPHRPRNVKAGVACVVDHHLTLLLALPKPRHIKKEVAAVEQGLAAVGETHQRLVPGHSYVART